ncbi:glycosyltransferase family 2 protein [uncultured Bacteroides sp.]|uniref:glycosyltransferase family 2 protein n=1 Tax=uncultured Bacteroides sp. TaxID=162156 RepID=UPI0025D7A314|nr:glycosyltransferase family 2 protein [uncultured Bacteroides sp.]
MKISVITATWNSDKTIEDTIKSVLHQKYLNIEHIIKDGGSKDNTVAICEDYKQKFYSLTDSPSALNKTMKILSDKDKGIYDAMNQGIEAATGDVIGILNSDDFFTSDDVLQRVAEEFEKDVELEALYGDIHFVKDNNLKKCTRYFSSKYFRPWILRFGFMPAHPSFYVRREVYEKYGLYDLQYRTSSDFEMMVRLFVKYKINAKYINKDFVTMRAGGESTAGIEAKCKVNQDIAGSLKKHEVYSNQLFQSLRYIWRIGELIYTKIKY